MFNGETQTDITDKLIKTAAATYSGFTYAYIINNDSINLYAFSFFDIEQSWASKRSKYILKHEQKHFDITEIYSRKFKKKIMELDFSSQPIDSLISQTYTYYEKKLGEIQYRYDNETGHGTNKEAQTSWDLLIEKELNETNKFEEPFCGIAWKKK